MPKSDGTFRMCTDYRKLNSVTKTNSFPVPRVDDCIDKFGHAKYVTKVDMSKGINSQTELRRFLILLLLMEYINIKSCHSV